MINIFKKKADGESDMYSEFDPERIKYYNGGGTSTQDESVTDLVDRMVPGGSTQPTNADIIQKLTKLVQMRDVPEGMDLATALVNAATGREYSPVGEELDRTSGDVDLGSVQPDSQELVDQPDSNIRRLMMALGIGGGAAAGGAGAVAALKKKKSPIDKAKGMGSDALSKLRSLIGR